MKKLLCLMIACVLLLTMAPGAIAQENYCALFDDAINLLRWNSPPWDVGVGDQFPLTAIMGYTRQQLCIDEYGEDLIEENGYSYYATYAIPADVFEAVAMDSFAVVEIDALRSYTSFFWDQTNFTGIDDFQNYQPDRHVYLFGSAGGVGDPSWYEVLGYTEEDGLYTVYSCFISLLWEEPTGQEGVDYIRIGEEYFAVEHYLRTVMAISNGRAQFHSWEEIDQIPDLEVNNPADQIFQSEDITIEAPAGVLPADATVTIGQPEETVMQNVQQALESLAESFVAYAISANAQPAGQVKLTIAIPEDFDGEALALFYISDEGILEQLDATVDAEKGTISAMLTQFGVYALVDLANETTLIGDVNGDGVVTTTDARWILLYIVGKLEDAALDTAIADVNQDGVVTTSDARMILLQIVGQT